MKKLISVCLTVILTLTMCICSSASFGTTYYIDSENGNDSNSGTSEANAWQTVENLRETQLNPGDSVLFKADCIFTVEELEIEAVGTEEHPIVISSYGEGDMPLLTTDKYADILLITDSSYITVSDLEMTAHNGGGIWINVDEKDSEGITLKNLKIHDIQNFEKNCRDDLVRPKKTRACVMVKNIYSLNPHPVNDLTISDCEFYDCGNGVSIWGGTSEDTWEIAWQENTPLEDVKFYYNQNTLVENCYFHDMDAEALVVGTCENALVTNCKAINCCQNDGLDENGNMTHVAAAMWFWGTQHSTIQYCEIAGQNSWGDGMSIDFDSRSNYCTYQYIYSHDNMRFIRCCAPCCGQTGNTVRYCLSVNDNSGQNRLGTVHSQETDFSFYNNTIINSQSFVMDSVVNGYIANNIFVGDITKNFTINLNKKESDGSITKHSFSGTFTNNCIYGMAIPSIAQNTITDNPCFAGNDLYDINSYRLNKNSPLIGAGTEIDFAGKDLYGNTFESSNNIGCYAGTGVDEKASTNSLDTIIANFETFLASIYQLFYDIVTMLFTF